MSDTMQTALRDSLAELFSLEEIKDLCFDLQSRLAATGTPVQVNLETAGGGTGGKKIQIQRLIIWLDRRGLLDEFVALARAARPGLVP